MSSTVSHQGDANWGHRQIELHALWRKLTLKRLACQAWTGMWRTGSLISLTRQGKWKSVVAHWKLQFALGGVFIPQKQANAVNQGFLPPQRAGCWTLTGRNSDGDMSTNVASNSIHGSQKLETTQMSVSWGMGRDGWANVVCPYSEIQLSDKKERTINTQNLDDSWRHYAEWKHPGSKGNILCSCIYMKFYRRQNYSDRKQISSSSRG